MKILYLILTLSIFGCSVSKNSFQKGEIHINNDQNGLNKLEHFSLKGKVKEMQSIHYILCDDKPELGYIITRKFNQYGNLTSFVLESEVAYIGLSTEYFYNDSQQLIKRVLESDTSYIYYLERNIQNEKFYKKNKPETHSSEEIRKYDKNNQLYYTRKNGASGNLVKETHFLYDRKSRIIQKEVNNSRGLDYLTTYEYKAKDLIVSEYKKSKNELSYPKSPYNIKTYSYDKNNFQVSSLDPKSKSKGKLFYEYEIDSHSNWHKKYTQDGAVKFLSVDRNIEYYK